MEISKLIIYISLFIIILYLVYRLHLYSTLQYKKIIIIFVLFYMFFFLLHEGLFYLSQWLITTGKQIEILYVKDPQEYMNMFSSSYLKSINPANMTLQQKIGFILNLSDIHLHLGVDFKIFEKGIYGIYHLGTEVSGLSSKEDPFGIILKIPFMWLQNDMPSEIIENWISQLQPSRVKVVTEIVEGGITQKSSLINPNPKLKNDICTFSFGFSMPFDELNHKNYGFAFRFKCEI